MHFLTAECCLHLASLAEVTGHSLYALTKGAEEASSAVWARKVKAALQQAKVLPQVPRS